MAIKKLSNGKYQAWYYSDKKTFSSLSSAKAYEADMKSAYKSSKSSSGSSAKKTSSSTSSKSSSSGNPTTVTRSTPTTSAPTTQSGGNTVTVEKDGKQMTVVETTPGLFGELGYTYVSGGPTPTSTPSIQDFSKALASGQITTQEQTDAFMAGQQPNEQGLIGEQGMAQFSQMLSGMDQAGFQQPQEQQAQEQADQGMQQLAADGQQMASGGVSYAPGSEGFAGLSPDEQAAQLRRYGNLPMDTTGAQYLAVGEQYYQQTPNGAVPVTNPDVERALRSGQLPSTEGAPSMLAGMNAMGSAGLDGTISGSPQTQAIFNGIANKYGISSDPNNFYNDPISMMKEMTTQVLSMMGYGEVNSEYESIANELEDLENDRDEELRDIDDNPWLTEGVRLRQRKKAEEKWADKIDSRVNKLQLLDNVRDDARQQAQFALGTAISLWDSQRQFEQQQLQLYYQQAQNEFDNQIKLAQLDMAAQSMGTSNMQEYLFAKESGYTGSFYNWMNPSSGGGGGGVGGGVVIPDPSTGMSTQYSQAAIDWASSIANGDAGLSNIPASEKSQYGGSLRTEVAGLLKSPIMAESQYYQVQRQLSTVRELLGMNTDKITGLGQNPLSLAGFGAEVAKYKQVLGIVSINERDRMKGSGAISDFEAKTLQESATALSRKLSNEEFKAELKNIEDVFVQALSRHQINMQLWNGGQTYGTQEGGMTVQSSSGNTYTIPQP